MNYPKLLLNNTFLKFAFFFSLAMILVAGLWPFNFWPKNEVEWLKDKSGVHFFGRGIIFGEQMPNALWWSAFNKDPLTIEICLQVDSESTQYVSRILSLYDSKGSEAFYIGQWISHLMVRTREFAPGNTWDHRNIGIKDALPKNLRRFVTVVEDQKGTRVYIDGILQKNFPGYFIRPKDVGYSAQIILGNSPTGNEYWTGNLFRLAIYSHALTSEEVLQHFINGCDSKFLLDATEVKPVVFYTFINRFGNTIYDQMNYYHLLMPLAFRPLQKTILTLPWKEFRFNFSYLSDILTNILGFIPFGFLLTCYLSKYYRKSTLYIFFPIIALGGILALAIELLQVYLPTRHSQLMDVFSNLFGTGVGILSSLLYLSHHYKDVLHNPSKSP